MNILDASIKANCLLENYLSTEHEISAMGNIYGVLSSEYQDALQRHLDVHAELLDLLLLGLRKKT